MTTPKQKKLLHGKKKWLQNGILLKSYLARRVEDLKAGDIESGKEYTITYVIDEKGLNDAIGLELVTTYTTGEMVNSMFIL